MFRSFVSSYAVLALFLSTMIPCAVVAQKKTEPKNPNMAEPSYHGRGNEPIEGQYIVLLKDNVNPHDESVGLMRAHQNAKVVDVYDTAINGFSVRNFPAARLSNFKKNPNVLDVIQVCNYAKKYQNACK